MELTPSQQERILHVIAQADWSKGLTSMLQSELHYVAVQVDKELG
jgi:hypothetical protein